MFVTMQKMDEILGEVQEEAGLDYARLNGCCCNTCTNDALARQYGEDSKGIWIKWFDNGGNKSRWSSHKDFYISHDVTKEQMVKVLKVLCKYFIVIYDGDDSQCIQITKKRASKT